MHDIGKVDTPIIEWPAHHGHAETGVEMIKIFIEKYKLPNEYKKAAIATKYHMKIIGIKKPGKKIKAFREIYKGGAMQLTIDLVKADKGVDLSADFALLKSILEKPWGKILIGQGKTPGKNFAQLILQEQVKEYKRRKL